MNVFIFLCVTLLWVVQGESLKFPDNFKFGVASASYQIEGAWNESGKGENIWDRLVHEHPDWIPERANGDIACDSYHKLDEDIRNLKWLGVDFYRFSLSWSRLLPSGYANHINPDGVRYYNQLIDALLQNNITPMVTLYHWDLPQPLQEIGGWPNVLIADHFEDYARIAFRLFGDRVKMWITFNEPTEVCQAGYADGEKAPAYNADGIGDYLCGRTLLLAHARAYRMYKKEFHKQEGMVGITISTNWLEPATNSSEDLEAANRVMQMQAGWWGHPIFSKTGDYSNIFKERIDQVSKEENFPRSRLIPFTEEEVTLIQGTHDFFGLNHYTTRLVSANTSSIQWKTPSYAKDIGVNMYVDPSWPSSAAPWLKSVPWGFRKLVKWIKDEYDNPPVYITENGWADEPGVLHDQERIDYYREYLKSLQEAISIDGCDVRGYAAWSILDNFEWRAGYTQRFGLFYVNFTSPGTERVAKDSAAYYKQVIKERTVDLFPEDIPIVRVIHP